MTEPRVNIIGNKIIIKERNRHTRVGELQYMPIREPHWSINTKLATKETLPYVFEYLYNYSMLKIICQ